MPIEGSYKRAEIMIKEPDPECIVAGELVLDKAKGELRREGNEGVSLTRTECRLLEAFLDHPGVILSHILLMRRVWNTDYVDDIDILYVYIHRLRKKLE